MIDDWLGAELARFADGMAWVTKRKNFDVFWPIGIPQASRIGAQALIDELTTTPSGVANGIPLRNPTSGVILYLYLIHGARELTLARSDRLELAERVLSPLRAAKANGLFALDGEHVLVTPLGVAADAGLSVTDWAHGGRVDPHYLRLLHQLCATTWAFGEAACFFNHRVVTERHGPYRGDDGTATLVRTAFDLDVSALWPELPGLSPPMLGFEVLDEFVDGEGPWFDLYANPIFSADIGSVRRAALVTHAPDGAVVLNPPVAEIEQLIDWLRSAIGVLTSQVSSMSSDAKARKVFRIMSTVARRLSLSNRVELPAEWEYGTKDPPVAAAAPLAFDPEAALRYYDLRQ